MKKRGLFTLFMAAALAFQLGMPLSVALAQDEDVAYLKEQKSDTDIDFLTKDTPENRIKTWKDQLWIEIWNETAWHSTNFGVDSQYYKEEDWYRSSSNVRFGYRFPLKWQAENEDHGWFLDPYIRLDLEYDFGNESWNKYAWNNHQKYGPGIRLRHEFQNDPEEPANFFWINSMTNDFYIEYLRIMDSIDSNKDDQADIVPEDNFRAGLNSYIAATSKLLFNEHAKVFAEMWEDFGYSSTNFYQDNIEDYYILQLQPKLGLSWIFEDFSLQPYLFADLVYDFGQNDWNKHEWLNNVKYGPGFRVSFSDIYNRKGTNIRLFVEYTKIHYFERVDEAEYENKADKDVVAGIELWLPFGSTKNSVDRA